MNPRYAVLHEIVKLIPVDGRWTAEERDQWLALVRVAFDYLVKIEERRRFSPAG